MAAWGLLDEVIIDIVVVIVELLLDVRCKYVDKARAKDCCNDDDADSDSNVFRDQYRFISAFIVYASLSDTLKLGFAIVTFDLVSVADNFMSAVALTTAVCCRPTLGVGVAFVVAVDEVRASGS